MRYSFATAALRVWGKAIVLLVIFLVLLLLLVQVFLPGRYLTEQVGNAAQMGPRDDLPEPSRNLARARRALGNLQETLPIFLTLAVLSIVLGEQSWLALIGAWLYLVARVSHVICYMKGLSPWRSVSFMAGLLGNLLMVIALVPHIWG
ncbi:MAPEG family protein [Devosia sp. 2618]|uniref:MAPEG family protein n=1 Tax=Devosia sp. 2618 TaxID=3156454 RepID=UPI0033950E1D